MKNLIFYQIYPRSFCDANGDGEGDVQGVFSKIEYLKNLGINAVWFSPCFESPNVDNGYDISNYCNISPDFGTLEEFERLIQALHENGIKVILDFVANHTSTEHAWFKQSRKSKDNPYRDYYVWRKTPPNDWESCFGGSAWEFDPQTEEYYLHSFAVEQADLNWDNPKVREEMKKVVDFWMKKGVDGFRCDVLDMISKDYEKAQIRNGPKIHEYIREIFGRESTSHLFTVGECWGSTPENVRMFCLPERKELQTVFNFKHLCGGKTRFTTQKPKLEEVCRRIAFWQKFTQENGVTPTIFLGNHDQARSLSKFGNETEYRYESATALAGIVLLHRGIPFLYQGEEIGMINPRYESIEDFNDVESLNYYRMNPQNVSEKERIDNINRNGRDNPRYAIPWDDSDIQSWLPEYSYKKQINVKKDLESDKSVYKFYQKLIALRLSEPCLTCGDYQCVEINEDYYVFTRAYNDETITVLVNFERESKLRTSLQGELILNNYDKVEETLKPYQLLVYKR